MARPKRTSSTPKYKWLGHIQHHFNDAEREDCIKWIKERTLNVTDALDTIVQMEIGVKVMYSSAPDGYHITLQPKNKNNFYYGYTVGITHSSMVRGIFIALYVVSELMEHEAMTLPENTAYPEW